MTRTRKRTRRRDRRGALAVLAAFVLVAMIVMVAFAVDLGYLQVAQSELQRSADASALAAAAELVDDDALVGSPGLSDEVVSARTYAVTYAGSNKVCSAAPAVDSLADVVVGNLVDVTDPDAPITFVDPAQYNAVQVTVRRTTSRNGVVPFFWGKVLGVNGVGTEMAATAVLVKNFSGFRAPADGSNAELLPFALDIDTWNALLAGNASDDWQYDAASGTVSAGSDGVKEINLYPQGTGSPGNRGTVDIGGANNSTSDIARQILDGISPQDFIDLGYPLEFDASGELSLNGDTGISAGVKDELAAIKGQPRVIPIFESVAHPGNNAQYTIVAFAGVRIMEVVLTGKQSSKRVIIQPAEIVARGGVPSSGGVSSYFMHSQPYLVR